MRTLPLIVLAGYGLLVGCSGDESQEYHEDTGSYSNMPDSEDDPDSPESGNYKPNESELEQWALEDGYVAITTTGEKLLTGYSGNARINPFQKGGAYTWTAQISFEPDDSSSPDSIPMQINIQSTSDLSGPLAPNRYKLTNPVAVYNNEKPDFATIATFNLAGEEYFELDRNLETIDGFVEFTRIEDVEDSYEKVGEVMEMGAQRVYGRFRVMMKNKQSAEMTELQGDFKHQANWRRMLQN